MTTMEEFTKKLKAFFKGVSHFLTETVEGYSMSMEDDNERDSLKDKLQELEILLSHLNEAETEELYVDTVEPNNNLQPPKDPDATSIKSTKSNASGLPHVRPPKGQPVVVEEEEYADTEITEPAPQHNDPANEIYDDTVSDNISETYEDTEGILGKKVSDDNSSEIYDETEALEQHDAKEPQEHEKKKKSTGKSFFRNHKHDQKKERLLSEKETGSVEDIHVPQYKAKDMEECDFKGMLKKHKALNAFIKATRYCAVKDDFLYYFENKSSKKQSGRIDLKEYKASVVQEALDKKKYIFRLASDDKNKKIYYFTTNMESDMKVWVHYLNHREIMDENDEKQVETNDIVQDIYEDTEEPDDKDPELQDDEELYEDPAEYMRNKDLQQARMEETAPVPTEPNHSVAPAAPAPRRAPLPPPPTDDELYVDAISPHEIPKRPVPDIPKEDHDEIYDDGISAPMNSSRENSLPPPPVECMRFDALYYGVWPCKGDTENELEFSRGDCIEVINKDKYEKEGWWVGKLNNKIGLVPKNFLAPMYKRI